MYTDDTELATVQAAALQAVRAENQQARLGRIDETLGILKVNLVEPVTTAERDAVKDAIADQQPVESVAVEVETESFYDVNDQLYDQQNNVQHVDAFQAWQYPKGLAEDQTIAIVDTKVNPDPPDLQDPFEEGFLPLFELGHAEPVDFVFDDEPKPVGDFVDDVFINIFEKVVNMANQQGKIIVAAAGTYEPAERPKRVAIPANIEGVISVAATDPAGKPSQSSPRAREGDKIDVAAPAERIQTTSADGAWEFLPDGSTSLAAPVVSGVAAIAKSTHPEMDTDQWRSRIRNTTFHTNRPQDRVGNGVVNAWRAMFSPPGNSILDTNVEGPAMIDPNPLLTQTQFEGPEQAMGATENEELMAYSEYDEMSEEWDVDDRGGDGSGSGSGDDGSGSDSG